MRRMGWWGHCCRVRPRPVIVEARRLAAGPAESTCAVVRQTAPYPDTLMHPSHRLPCPLDGRSCPVTPRTAAAIGAVVPMANPVTRCAAPNLSPAPRSPPRAEPVSHNRRRASSRTVPPARPTPDAQRSPAHRAHALPIGTRTLLSAPAPFQILWITPVTPHHRVRPVQLDHLKLRSGIARHRLVTITRYRHINPPRPDTRFNAPESGHRQRTWRWPSAGVPLQRHEGHVRKASAS